MAKRICSYLRVWSNPSLSVEHANSWKRGGPVPFPDVHFHFNFDMSLSVWMSDCLSRFLSLNVWRARRGENFGVGSWVVYQKKSRFHCWWGASRRHRVEHANSWKRDGRVPFPDFHFHFNFDPHFPLSTFISTLTLYIVTSLKFNANSPENT